MGETTRRGLTAVALGAVVAGLFGAMPAEYRRCFDPAAVHATSEDYRAGATVDLRDDAADAQARIACPVLVLWSARGLGAAYDVLGVWRGEADDVRGQALDCGHFLAEERPDEVIAALTTFMTA